MAEDVSINVAGTWKAIDNCEVNVGGAWKQVEEISINVGGVWKTAWVNTQLSGGTGGTVSQVDGLSPYNSTVAIRFNTDGTVETGTSLNGAAISWSSAGNWIDPVANISGNEEVRFTNFNGAGGGDWTSEAAADDVWIGITTTRSWSMNSTVLETISFTCDFEVRDTGAGLDTGSSAYTFSITNTT
jgi:hypothetical protein